MKRVVGIDLGTTNSLVAVMEGGIPKVIGLPGGGKLLPSVISFLDPREPLVGAAAKEKRITEVDKTVYSVKRFMGRGAQDVSDPTHLPPFNYGQSSADMVKLSVGDRNYTPIELSAMILRTLREAAEIYLKGPVTQAVVTVPAYFNDSQRQATQLAGKLAGLEVVRMVNEPTAAALAYGWGEKRQGLIAVYDLGGGTFDISILKLSAGIFEVRATHGDTLLGGDDMDHRLLEVIAAECLNRGGPQILKNRAAQAAFLKEAERIKCILSEQDSAMFRVELKELNYVYQRVWTRQEFETEIVSIIEKTCAPCEAALRDAGLKIGEIDDVVLVGGSTRIPLVRRRVREIFGREPNVSVNPDEAVALGAAIQADILAGNIQDTLLLDVVPLSLGLETMGGITAKLIHRNQTIPARASEFFSTYVDGQIAVDMHIVQGEREMAEDNRSLARFQLKGIPPLPAGVPQIQVDFIVDANGILNVHAKELRTGIKQQVEVKPTYGLTDQEVERMLSEAMAHAADDMRQVQLAGARTEAEAIIRVTEKALRDGANLVSIAERQVIDNAVVGLKKVCGGDDHAAIRERIHLLDTITQPLAQKIMDQAVQRALKNREIV